MQKEAIGSVRARNRIGIDTQFFVPTGDNDWIVSEAADRFDVMRDDGNNTPVMTVIKSGESHIMLTHGHQDVMLDDFVMSSLWRWMHTD